MKRLFVITATIAFATGCAGPNPNPGERTTDMAWTSAKYEKAVETARPAAEAGQPWAQLRLGIFYANGWGLKRDTEKAEYWYKKAAAQKATGQWADGLMAGAVGRSGYFNQNSDARIAQYNLAQLYLVEDRNLSDAKALIETVISESEGKPVFFCCEFAGGRSFFPHQFQELKQRIEKRLAEKQ